ncbi:MAG TPA: YCF48-related protein [Pyrinomonadaceae bacterium]
MIRKRARECRLIWAALFFMAACALTVCGQEGWTAQRRGEEGRDLNAVFFADQKRGWIAGDNGFVSRTEDGGKTWAQQPVGTNEAINDIYFRGKDEGYVLAANRIFYTNNSGERWREIRRFSADEFGGAELELYSIRFSGKKKGWIVGSVSRKDVVVDSLLIYTEDGGASWLRQRVPSKEELIHVDFTSDQRGWVVGASGSILHTEDGGRTWLAQSSGTNATLYHVDFRNERTGWAVGERGTILRTTDGGENWFPITVPVRSTLLSVQFASEDEGWIVGRGGTILRSGDGGRTWVRQESRTKQHLYALFVDKKSGWAVGGDGIVLQYER